MTAPYQVFVDGTRDRSPQAIARVAAAMAARYGLPPAELEARLARGRFKVKAGVDRETAESYARDLEQLGAICVVVDAAGKTVDLAAAAPSAAAAKPRLGIPPPSTRGAPPPRSASGPLPPRAAGAAPARVQSGPLAGLTGNAAPADLGALGRKDGAIALSSLDGEADEPVIEPTSLMAASFGPSVTPPPAAAPGAAPGNREMTGPVDMFTAPDEEAEVELALDVDVVAERAKKAASVPPPTSGASAAQGFAGRRATAADTAPAAARPKGPPLGERARDLLANARARFAAGVLAAVLIGFIPAHIVASIREGSAFAEVDGRLRDRYAAVDSDETYAALDNARATALDRKYAERREIALIAVLVWAAFGAGLAYVWFRRVPWDRIAPVR